MVSDSVSFGAKFVYKRGFNYKNFFPSKNKQVISDIDKFLDFIKSEKGKEFLEKHPEKDIFELRVYKNSDNKIIPKLWHRVCLSNGTYGRLEEGIDIKAKKQIFRK